MEQRTDGSGGVPETYSIQHGATTYVPSCAVQQTDTLTAALAARVAVHAVVATVTIEAILANQAQVGVGGTLVHVCAACTIRAHFKATLTARAMGGIRACDVL